MRRRHPSWILPIAVILWGIALGSLIEDSTSAVLTVATMTLFALAMFAANLADRLTIPGIFQENRRGIWLAIWLNAFAIAVFLLCFGWAGLFLAIVAVEYAIERNWWSSLLWFSMTACFLYLVVFPLLARIQAFWLCFSSRRPRKQILEELLADWMPVDGKVFYSGDASSLEQISSDLRRVVAFLMEQDNGTPFGDDGEAENATDRLERVQDGWEHDGLFFAKGQLEYQDLVDQISTPQSMVEMMSCEFRVFEAFSPENHSWYLRIHAEEDEDHENEGQPVGEYSLVLASSLVSAFESWMDGQFGRPLICEDTLDYFS